MKNLYLIILSFLISATSIAQNGINYKAIIKDANGGVVANQTITIQFQVISTSYLYREQHTPTTDDNGLIIVVIGEGTATTGNFNSVDWASDDYFLNVQVLVGNDLVDLGTTPFKHVPYAIVAESVKNAPFELVSNTIKNPNENDFLIGTASQDHVSGYEKKLFYDISESAFRAGTIDTDDWDEINRGANTFGFGVNHKITGDYSTAFGRYIEISGNRSLGVGASHLITKDYGFAFGSYNFIDAPYSVVFGESNQGKHDYAFLHGNDLRTVSDNQTIFGSYNVNNVNSLFQIANGTSDANRNTLFSIKNDGAIVTDFYEGVGERLIAADPTGKLVISSLVLPSPSSGLENISENGNSGWRLVGKNPIQFGDIGNFAVDLSTSFETSIDHGATGAASFAIGTNTIALATNTFAGGFESEASGGNATALGYRTKAEALASFAIGSYNIGGGNPASFTSTNPIFEIGNGISEQSRSNAFTVLQNGTITAPSLDIAEITSDKALITKEYYESVDTKGLEFITEGGNTGWRLVGKNPIQFGNIGNFAVDLSTSFGVSTEHGATGNNSFAAGQNTIASGFSSNAVGFETQATGYASTAVGFRTKAEAYGSLAIGSYNIGGGVPTSNNSANPIFEIGNGSSSIPSNAFTVLQNGNIGIGKHAGLLGKVEIETNSTATHPHLTLIEDNASFARLKFKNTNRNGDDYWDIAGFIGTTVADDRLNFFNSDGGDIMSIEGDGDVRVNGSLVHSSDRRLKRDIETIDFGIAEILKINPVQYNWKDKADKPHKSLGVIAQEIQRIIPNVVQIGNDAEQTLSVSYTELIPVLIKAIQEQQAIIDSQTIKITTQDDKYALLEKMVLALASQVNMDRVIDQANNISAAEKE